MYGHRSCRVKTDRRDVAALAGRVAAGSIRAHRRSATQREVQERLNIRHALVDTRTRFIAVTRAITRAAALRDKGE